MEKNRVEIHREMIRSFQENERKWDEVKQRLEENPIWQEMKTWTHIDWNDGQEEIEKKGVRFVDTFGKGEWRLENQERCFIRNFPAIVVQDARLNDCVFLNCGQVTIQDGVAAGCTFSNVETLFLDKTKVYDSRFEDLFCDGGDFVISMEDSSLSGCGFERVNLENEVYLADGVGECLVEKCSFKEITTDREDGEIFACKDFKGKLIRRTYSYDMVDWKSCTGLDSIAVIPSGAVLIGSFEMELGDNGEF